MIKRRFKFNSLFLIHPEIIIMSFRTKDSKLFDVNVYYC